MKEYTMSNAIQEKITIPPIAYTYDGAEKLTIKSCFICKWWRSNR